MSFTDKKKYTFPSDMVVKGVNKPIFKDDGTGKMVRSNPALMLTRKFDKGTVVDGDYFSGRGAGSTVSFNEEGGMLPNGTHHSGEVIYSIQFEDRQFAKPVHVAEVIQEDGVDDTQKEGAEKNIFTPTNISIGVLGLIGVFLLLKVTKVIK